MILTRTSPAPASRFTAGLLMRVLGLLLTLIAVSLIGIVPAWALKPIEVGAEHGRIEITGNGVFLDSRGDNIQVETAPGPDGLAGRMGVKASAPGLSPNWVVFALKNVTNRPIERWLTAERYNVFGSGVVWPDLDARRVEAVTPSLGFLPERVKSERADIFQITLEPGQTVTYVAELATDRMARINLWKPLEYELKARERQLFNGILLGITGVLGIFLTAIFAANHKPIFPSAALVMWCVLAYLCVDFGFWHKLFQLRPEDNSVYRAATEAAMAASLLIFLYIFLRLFASHGIARMLLGVWMIAQLALIAVAIIDARLAATFARASFAAIGSFGMLASIYLAVRGQDRALALLPTWILFVVWVFAASVTLTGRLSGEIVVSGLSAGLVLITVLIGFTVTQFAFRSLEPMYGATPSEQQVRSMAIDGSGSSVWEWNARRAEIKTGPLVEMTLGLAPGELTTKVDDFCNHLHEADRERFKLSLWSLQERSGGEIRMNFRMLHSDNSYRWFELEAASVPSNDRRVLRCLGLMREVTEQRRAQERLLYDAVHDSLTGLPNRELFLDRLGVAVTRAKSEPLVRPAVMLIDMDKFKSVNSTFGLTFGDSLLLTIARRLQRHLGPQDTLARIGGNQFALMLMQPMEPMEVVQFGERVRRALRSPIRLAGQEIVLTGAIGIAVHEVLVPTAADLFKHAEIAMYRAKRGGADRVEVYNPKFSEEVDDRAAIENELRAALERDQLFVLYQPIIQLSTEELAGYEALVRWKHPRLGMLNPDDFIPVAEESDLIVKLGTFLLTQAATEAARWQRILPRAERPVFVSVNVSSRQLFRPDLMKEIKHVVGRALVPYGVLRLEVSEPLVMENPEKAIEQLEVLRSAGAGLSLDEFGTGYSSLSYLQRFPFDTIKIDRDLVQATGGDGTGAGSAIVRSIVALAHELGKKVVAEGVEHQSDVGFLRSIGCEYAEGFYYGGPMPPRDVEKMLRQIRKSEHKLHRVGLFRTKSQSDRKTARARQPESAVGAEEPEKLEAVSMSDRRTEGDKKAKGANLRKRSRSSSKAPVEQRPVTALPPPAIGAATRGTVSPGGASRPPAAAPPGPPQIPPQRPTQSGRQRNNGAPAGFAPLPPANGGPPPMGAPGRTGPPSRQAVRSNGAAPSGQPPQFSPAGPPPPPVSNGAHAAANGEATRAGNGRPPQPAPVHPAGTSRPSPDLSTLPPAIAASLAKLANTSTPQPRPAPNGRTQPPPEDKR